MAQRNGTMTQTAPAQAMSMAMNFDAHLEFRQSRFSISKHPKLLDTPAHLFEEKGYHYRYQDQIKDPHRRPTAKVRKLDGGQIRHDTEKLRTRTWPTAGQGIGQTKRLQPFDYSQQNRDRQHRPS